MTKQSAKTINSLPYLTLDDVATVLKLNVRSVRRMIKPQKLKSGKVRAPILKACNISTGSKRGIWRIAKQDLDDFMSSRKK